MKAKIVKTELDLLLPQFDWEIIVDDADFVSVRGNAPGLQVRPEIMWSPRTTRPEDGVYLVGYEPEDKDPYHSKHLGHAANLDDAIELLKTSLRDRLYYLKDEIQICHDILSRL